MANYWRVASGTDGILLVELDLGPGHKKNILKRAVFEELSDLMDKATSGRPPAGMIIASAKEDSFCAGADINEFLPMFEHPKKACGLLYDAEKLLLKILNSPFPIIAAINGECLGGGLELVLACHYRIAARDPRVKFALPETSLGIIPGFGGTQLLPRIVSMETAAQMILGNKELSAEEAMRRGLVDECVEQDRLIPSARAVILRGDAAADLKKSPPKRWIEKLPCGWRAVLNRAGKEVIGKTKGLYPAYKYAVEALRASKKSLKKGLRREHELFIKCLETSEARSCVNFFFLEAKAKSVRPSKIVSLPSSYGVIGAGIMGQGIAHALLSTEQPVHLHDLFQSAAENGKGAIEAMLAKGVAKGKITAEAAEKARDNLTISYGEDLKSFIGCDFVVEAIKEDLAVKHKTLRAVEEYLRPNSIVATNTSSLLPSEIAAGLKNPERLIAMHFFNPVHKMKLVEIACHANTWPDVLPKTVAVTKAIGKLPLVLERECPGLLVNRVLMQFLAKATQGVFAGHVDPWDLDRTCEASGMEMGPFKMLDHVGLDIATDVLHTMQKYYPDRIPEAVQKINFAAEKERGFMGRKSGKGFYFWNGDAAVKPNYRMREVFSLVADRAGDEAIARYFMEKIMDAMRSEAEAIIKEGVCLSKDMIDYAMIRGAGMLHNRRGIFGLPPKKIENNNPVTV